VSSSVQQVDWVSRVLGVIVSDQPNPTAGDKVSASTPEPFQVFVKSLDDVTLTLRLPNGPETTLGELQDMIEGRAGLSLDEHSLMIGSKPFRSAHAKLPVAEYGLQRNQTLSLQGSLKGGFGERAAMADTIQHGIVHGNVLGDIEETSGVSKAKVGFCRGLLDPTKQEGQELLKRLFNKLKTEKALPDEVETEADLQAWMAKSTLFLSAITSSHLKAGNCREYANVAYTSLVSKTQNQTVHKVGMTGPSPATGQGYDHAFVITCPTDHGDDIVKLYNDNEAMVVDPWWNSTICTFKKFADGNNPYGEKVDLKKNLKCRNRAAATGKAPVSQQVESAMKVIVDELSGKYKADLEQKAQEIGKKVQDIAKAVQEVENCKRAMNEAQEKINPDSDDSFSEWDKAQQEHVKTLNKLREAKEALGSTFGASGEIWNRRKIEDVREDHELFRTFDQACKSGDNSQLEVAMKEVKPDEFFNYLLTRDGAVMKQVLSSQELRRYFRDNCGDLTDDDDFSKLCEKMSADHLNEIILNDQNLAGRYEIAQLAEESPFASADDFLPPKLQQQVSAALAELDDRQH
jgi:hypothetical protein